MSLENHRPSPGRPIFRPEAVQRYMQGREETVFPRLVSPRAFIYLWALFGFLVIAALFAWWVRVPVYASGLAVVVSDRSQAEPDQGVVLAAFLPAGDFKVGQNLLVQIDANNSLTNCAIIAVEPDIKSPEAIRAQFALDAGVALAVSQPSIVALARFDPPQSGLDAASYLGSVYRVSIQTRSRRVISLLPWIGWFFRD